MTRRVARARLRLLQRLIVCSRANTKFLCPPKTPVRRCICGDRKALAQATRWARAWQKELTR